MQVVLLGAGMDSRAWRLELPPGTCWYELDQKDILAAKGAALDALGAQQVVQGCPGRPALGPQLLGLFRQGRWLLELQWASLVAWWNGDAVLKKVVKYLHANVRLGQVVLHSIVMHSNAANSYGSEVAILQFRNLQPVLTNNAEVTGLKLI